MYLQKALTVDELMATLAAYEPSIVIACVSMVVALVTALFTAYQAFLSRCHNRLSVRPALTLWTDEYEQDFVNHKTGRADKYYMLRCDLLNNGIGPAILKDYSVSFDGEKIGSSHDRRALEAAIQDKIDTEGGILKNSVSVFGLEYPFPAGDKKTLIEIGAPMHFDFDKKKYQDFLDKFDADLSYECMYGKRFKHSTKDTRRNAG